MQETSKVVEPLCELPEIRVISGTKFKDSLLGRLFPDFSDRTRASIIYALGESIKTYGAGRKVTVSYNAAGREIAHANINSEDRSIYGSIEHFRALDSYLGFARAVINIRLTTRIPLEEHSGLARVVTEHDFLLK